jgi:hypothetical protein
VWIRCTGEVLVSFDSGAGSDTAIIPFDWPVGAPRPDDDDMHDEAEVEARRALQAWADRARPRYVMSASWTAHTDTSEPLGLPMEPPDSDWWEGDDVLDEGDDGYIVHPRGDPFGRGSAPHTPAVAARLKRGTVWTVSRRSTVEGRKTRRRDSSPLRTEDFL